MCKYLKPIYKPTIYNSNQVSNCSTRGLQASEEKKHNCPTFLQVSDLILFDGTGTLKITLPVQAQLACNVATWWAGSTCRDLQADSTCERLQNRPCDCP